MRALFLFGLTAYLAVSTAAAVEVGVARVDITPTHPVVLAGYGSRTVEHEGIDTRIWARALAIGSREPVLLLAVDNCGVPDPMTAAVVERLGARAGLDDRRVVICSTHTHNAPSLPGYANVLWGGRTTSEQEANMERYGAWLTERLVEVGLDALSRRREATLEWGLGRVEFGGNRRVMQGGTWRGFGFQIDGPVDHSLPVLLARDGDGKPFAVWTNYACHCTTLGARNRIHGDWAGYSNDAIEASFPGVIALTTIGCGADVGPQPSGSDGAAKSHGNAIAREVRRLVDAGLEPLAGVPAVKSRHLELPLDELPDRARLDETAKRNDFNGENARRQLKIIERDGALPAHVEYPVTTWTFGDDLAIVFLAGEVVVDYAVRLKRELDWSRLWINGWTDDVPSYIPSRRILDEGGYEAEFSQVYYELPARYAPEVEDLIVSTVKGLVTGAFAPRAALGPSPFHRHPMLDPERLARPPALSDAERSALEQRARAVMSDVRGGKTPVAAAALALALETAQNGFARIESNDGGVDSWFNYTGTKCLRPYVRQLERGATIAWSTATPKRVSGDRACFAFAAGVGYSSQPETEGFHLLIGDEVALEFDIVRAPARWTDEDETVELLYVPTWTSSDDSGGFFFLTLPTSRVTEGKPLRLGVRSRGEGSRRWFAVDYYTDAARIARETLRE